MAACPICHREMIQEEEAFLNGCMHCFCYECILKWSDTQLRTNAEHLSCPVCKSSYRSVYHDCVLGTYRRHQFLPQTDSEDGDLDPSPAVLSSGHRQRRSMYFGDSTKLRGELENHGRPPRKPHDPIVLKWVERELQALMLEEDVQLIVGVVMGVLKTAKKPGTRSDIAAPLCEEVLRNVAEALEPFLGNCSKQFSEELDQFVNSGLNMAAYDAMDSV
ncbi:hypothetical protein BSKO_01260 [Bryopsis sp. KO-2023]|nr:hypothetical protein BSKO_01260 [Bryopsis sp. KO-2023]